jgi:hypothetical protein
MRFLLPVAAITALAWGGLAARVGDQRCAGRATAIRTDGAYYRPETAAATRPSVRRSWSGEPRSPWPSPQGRSTPEVRKIEVKGDEVELDS